MSYLLDTCVISELTKPRPEPRVVEWVGRHNEADLCLSVITIGEIRKGIARLPDSAKRRDLDEWLNQDLRKRFHGRILRIDVDTAETWGVLSARAEKEGRPVPVLDGLIAATAHAAHLTIVTRNSTHMAATGVEIVDPWAD